jgi:hypothetical protein
MDPNDLTRGAVNLEEAFFTGHNARLLEEMRKNEEQKKRREMLRRVVDIQDEAFLDRLVTLGIGPETAMALRLIPLVFVAWADGSIDEKEREAILDAATRQGVAAEDTARRVLKDWLERRPGDRLLALWKEYVRHIWGRFTPDEQLRMRKNLLDSARDVAAAAGGFLGMAKISAVEQRVLDDLASAVD